MRRSILEQRGSALEDEHITAQRMLMARALPRADGSISSDFLFATLRLVLPENTTYVHDAVTNTIPLFEQLRPIKPGSVLGKGGSGLGWASAAAIGVRLALDKYEVANRPFLTHRAGRDATETGTLVCSVTGDGAFMFGCPSSTYWAQHRLNTPFLTIVLNNGGWRATRVAGVSDEIIGYDLTEDAPDYVGIAIAASNGTLWGKQIRKTCDLKCALQAAVKIVLDEKRGALLEVFIS